MRDEKQISNIEPIYVKLLDEDIDVYRPVKAIKINDYIYKIIDDDQEAYKEDGEVWEFKKGDMVKCSYKNLSKGSGKKKPTLVAASEYWMEE